MIFCAQKINGTEMPGDDVVNSQSSFIKKNLGVDTLEFIFSAETGLLTLTLDM
jgi:hypothetical protein